MKNKQKGQKRLRIEKIVLKLQNNTSKEDIKIIQIVMKCNTIQDKENGKTVIMIIQWKNS